MPPDRPPYGCCAGCGQSLGANHFAFAMQGHEVVGATLDAPGGPTGLLEFGPPLLEARFCSRACCEKQLPELLDSYGLPPAALHTLVGVGPLHPCAHCSQPVFLGNPHGAWVWGERRFKGATLRSGWEYLWLDVMAVVCNSCGGAEQACARRRGRSVAQAPRLRVVRSRRASRDKSRTLPEAL